jgi:tRNA threonylcarbamoyladenosine biosynthesis protein TsaB
VRILGFDTATPATAAAYRAADGRVTQARHEPEPGQRPQHAQTLLPLIDEVLPSWDEVDRIAVGVGPGTFTGLRIGIATARALAQARDLPLVGISTLAALARNADPPVLAVLDARRGEAFAAAYDAHRAEILAPAALGPEALQAAAADLGPGVRAIGDGAIRFRERLAAAGAVVPPDESTAHRLAARHVCDLALEATPAPGAAVLPDYRRRPDAELRHRPR